MTMASGEQSEQTGAVPGRCLCGAVRYAVTPPTLACSHCHCRSCRRWQGAALATWASLPRAQLALLAGADALRRYESSPGVRRAFCGRCGSPLFYEGDDEPGVVYVTVGTLEGALDRAPARHVSYEERLPWMEPGDGLPRFRGKTEPFGE
jgi:hypothetical protein